MIHGYMKWYGGKEKITDKLSTKQMLHPLVKTKHIKYVMINRGDAEAEDLSDGDIIGELKIKLSDEVISNHFWFIEENKA